jgi:hypothetical protein
VHVALPHDDALALQGQEQIHERLGRRGVARRLEDGHGPGDDDGAILGPDDLDGTPPRLSGERVLEQQHSGIHLAALHLLEHGGIASRDGGSLAAQPREEGLAILRVHEHGPGERRARGERITNGGTSLPPLAHEIGEGSWRRGPLAVDQDHGGHARRRVAGIEIHQGARDPEHVRRGVAQEAPLAREPLVQERIGRGEDVGTDGARGPLGLEAAGHLLAPGLVPVDLDVRELLLQKWLERINHVLVHGGVDPHVSGGCALAGRRRGRLRGRGRFDAARGQEDERGREARPREEAEA